MTNKFPMTLLAQDDGVFVFQTAAVVSSDARPDTDVEGADVEGADVEGADVEGADVEDISFIVDEKDSLPSGLSSKTSYGELNLGLHVHDDAAKVLDNRMQLLTAINEQVARFSSSSNQESSVKQLHWVNQVHGRQVHDIDATDLSMDPVSADAMVSQQDSIGLAMMTADCVPVVLYQPSSGQVAAIHAGWKGLACGVISATVKRFTESGDIKAWIGVCISRDNYEVNTDVRDKLLTGCIENQTLSAQAIDDFDDLFSIPSDEAKIKLDLPKLAAAQLVTAGAIVENESDISCSYADSLYYSYRRKTHLQQQATGRMALIIVRS
ncbi:MAG: polyphenol oxidase family protein [Moraxellaceae bacterium]